VNLLPQPDTMHTGMSVLTKTPPVNLLPQPDNMHTCVSVSRAYPANRCSSSNESQSHPPFSMASDKVDENKWHSVENKDPA
jgi:hypothetical protein